MTNASVRNTSLALFGVAVAIAFSVGAFATTASAQDDGFTYADTGYSGQDNSGFTYADTGYSGQDNSGFTYADTGYDPSNDSGFTYADTGYDPSNSNGYTYADTGYDSGCNSDCGTTYADTGYDANCSCDTNTQEYEQYQEQQYQEQAQQQQQQVQQQQQQRIQQAQQTFRSPSFMSSVPSYQPIPTPSYPVPHPTPIPTPVPQPAPHFTTPVSNITNQSCLYNSCNVTDNSITDNSINNSFNTATLARVTPQPIVQYQIPQQNLFCSITANGRSLSWTSTGATQASLSDGIGRVAINGTLQVNPETTRTYVLTIWGANGQTATCSATVAATAPYVSLSQIPYTGFDFGTIGNSIYWMGLMAFAAAGAYLMIYFKGGAFALAGSMLGGNGAVALSDNSSEDSEEETPEPTTSEPEVTPAPAMKVFELPVMTERSTRDTMAVTRTANGVPTIVINRS